MHNCFSQWTSVHEPRFDQWTASNFSASLCTWWIFCHVQSGAHCSWAMETYWVALASHVAHCYLGNRYQGNSHTLRSDWLVCLPEVPEIWAKLHAGSWWVDAVLSQILSPLFKDRACVPIGMRPHYCAWTEHILRNFVIVHTWLGSSHKGVSRHLPDAGDMNLPGRGCCQAIPGRRCQNTKRRLACRNNYFGFKLASE